MLTARFSVVITCHNKERYVAQAIESALMQSLRPAEIIVVDDGSTDDSYWRIREYAYAVTVMSVTQRGMAAARNAGIMASSMPWIVHLDADDWLEPNWIEEVFFCTPPAKAVVSGIKWHYADGSERGPEMPATENPALADVVGRNTHYSCAAFEREALVAAGGYNPTLGGSCDWGLWADFALHGWPIAYCHSTFYNYRVLSDSLSHGPGARAERIKSELVLRELYA